MSSATCTNCGFVGFVTDRVCDRCGAAMGQQRTYPAQAPFQESSGTPRVPAYGLPRSDPRNPEALPASGIWRRASVLAFHKTASLPDRCIKCNAPAHGRRINKTLHWHHPALYLLLPIGLLVYAVIATVERKTAKVSIGFCELHKSHRTRLLGAGWLSFFLSLGAFFAALGTESGIIALVGVALLIAAVVLSILGGRFIRVKRIDDRFVYLKGVHPEYLDGFPSV